jgi:hypothetical protein
MKMSLKTCPVDTNVYAKNMNGIYVCYQPQNSVEHSIESGYQIKFCETGVLAQTSDYMDWLVKEATEIKLHSVGKTEFLWIFVTR